MCDLLQDRNRKRVSIKAFVWQLADNTNDVIHARCHDWNSAKEAWAELDWMSAPVPWLCQLEQRYFCPRRTGWIGRPLWWYSQTVSCVQAVNPLISRVNVDCDVQLLLWLLYERRWAYQAGWDGHCSIIYGGHQKNEQHDDMRLCSLARDVVSAAWLSDTQHWNTDQTRVEEACIGWMIPPTSRSSMNVISLTS